MFSNVRWQSSRVRDLGGAVAGGGRRPTCRLLFERSRDRLGRRGHHGGVVVHVVGVGICAVCAVGTVRAV